MSAGPSGITIGSCVLVTGDTYTHRDKIKAIGGGVWCKPMSGWVFPESQRADVEAALASAVSSAGGDRPAVKAESGAKGEPGANAEASDAAPADGKAADAPEAPQPSVNAGATLTLVKHKRAVLVKGDTVKVKVQLKALKGSWNRSLGGWIFQGNRKEDVIQLLRADETNVVTDETGNTNAKEPAAKRVKRGDDFIVDDEEFDDDDDDDDDDD